MAHPKGLGVRASSEVVYSIGGGGYHRFLADFATTDTRLGPGRVAFQVWGDGVKLYDSGVLTSASATPNVSVDVTGVEELKLVALDDWGDIDPGLSVWAGARLVGGTPATPTAPTGLAGVAASPTTAALTWTDASANEWGFEFQRSTDGANYTAVAILPTGMTRGSDAALQPGETYHYRVLAFAGGGESAFATAVEVEVPLSLPAGWAAQDVGGVLTAGTSNYDDATGTFTLTASGTNIYNDEDQFQFAYDVLAGDGELVAEVTSVGNTDDAAKAGVMIRAGLTDDAPHAAMVVRPDGTIMFLFRPTAGGQTLSRTDLTTPGWVKVGRSGDTFTGYYSTDGTTWVAVSSGVVDMGTTAYGGLAVTAGDAATVNTSPFDRVALRTYNSLVQAQSTWKYRDNGSNQGTAWRATSFSDGSWSSGAVPLGYNTGEEQTTVGYGSNSNNKYRTTYFRKAFEVADPSAIDELILRIQRDDGAVVYLNGTEVFRTNMPSGTISYTTLASSNVIGSEGHLYKWFEQSVSPSLLTTGTNVLAVEVHQFSASSPDLLFDAMLFDPAEVPLTGGGSLMSMWTTTMASAEPIPGPATSTGELKLPSGEDLYDVTGDYTR